MRTSWAVAVLLAFAAITPLGGQRASVRGDLSAKCDKCADAAARARTAANEWLDQQAKYDDLQEQEKAAEADRAAVSARLTQLESDPKADPLEIQANQARLNELEKEIDQLSGRVMFALIDLVRDRDAYNDAIESLDACNATCVSSDVIPIAGDSTGEPDPPTYELNGYEPSFWMSSSNVAVSTLLQDKLADIGDPIVIPASALPVAQRWFNPLRLIEPTVQAATADVHIMLIDKGGSTGQTLVMSVLNMTGKPVRLGGQPFSIEPIKSQSQQQVAQAFSRLSKAAATRIDLKGYCLEFLKAPPGANTLYRLAPKAVQQKFAPMSKLLQSADRIEKANALHPDSNPAAYADSIKQWSLWSIEQKLNDRRFSDALVDYTKKHAQAAGMKWSPQSEAQIRAAAPNRWRDITSILRDAGMVAPQ